MSFDPRAVAQMAAFFAQKEGGNIYVLKLMNLLYLADRLSIEKYGEPISWDHMVSMDHGPALSETLDLINGFKKPDAAAGWDEWIKDRENHQVAVARSDFGRSDLSHLSNADIGVLEETWNSYGHMDRWQICDYTHDNCPEWTDPHGSSIPIAYEDVYRAIGRSSKEVVDLYSKIREKRVIDRIFASM